MKAPRPRKLRFYIGGYHAPSIRVSYDDPILLFEQGESGCFDELPPPPPDGEPGFSPYIEPTAEQWQQFRNELDRLKVWEWHKSYDDKDICDGEQWEFYCVWGSKRVNATGSNLYPEGFDEFHEALSVLLGRPPGFARKKGSEPFPHLSPP